LPPLIFFSFLRHLRCCFRYAIIAIADTTTLFSPPFADAVLLLELRCYAAAVDYATLDKIHIDVIDLMARYCAYERNMPPPPPPTPFLRAMP